MSKHRALRTVYYFGAITDAVAATAMFVPRFGGMLFGVDAAAFGPEYRFAMYLGSALMLGWTLLLLWGARKPVARRAILLLTAIPVMPVIIAATGYALAAALIARSAATPAIVFQSVVLVLFAGAWYLAHRTAVRSAGVEPVWEQTDALFERALLPADDVLERVLTHSNERGLPAIQVSPLQGSLLHLLALAVGARRILEIGALGGYSTVWLARALPEDGKLVSLELDELHAETARANLEHAGLGARVEVRVGPALETLPTLESEEPFDFVFIDADKEHMPDYYTWAKRLTRSGGLILADNVVRGGRIAEERFQDPSTVGVRQLMEILESEQGVVATAMQTVGSKGYDGFALIRVGTGDSSRDSRRS